MDPPSNSPYGPVKMKDLRLILRNSATLIFDGIHDIYGEIIVKLYKVKSTAALSARLREAFLQAKLNHPWVVNILDVGIEKESEEWELVLSLEKLKKDLSQEIDERAMMNEWFTDSELLDFLTGMIRVFSEAQEKVITIQNICHRDIKPSNIFVKGVGEYKVGDFGEAKIVAKLAEKNTLCGTLAYMSPILRKAYINDEKKVKHNPFCSDVYSLGMTVLSMCLLKNFRPENMNQETLSHIQRVVDSLHYSDSLKELLKLMLSEQESNRPDFVTLRDVVDSLARKENPFTWEMSKLLRKIETEIKVSQKASAMLASYIEDLWTYSILSKWKLPAMQRDFFPQFFVRKMDYLEYLSGCSRYDIIKSISEYHFNFIPISQFIADSFPQAVTKLNIEQQTESGFKIIYSMNDHHGSYTSFNDTGTIRYTIHKDYKTVTIYESQCIYPSLARKLKPTIPYFLSINDLYYIGSILLVITDLTNSRVAIQIVYPVDSSSRYFEFDQNEVTIGCDKSCLLHLVDVSLSQKHAVIRCVNEVWTIEDSHSINGVYMCCHNMLSMQRESNEMKVRDGDSVNIDKELVRFVFSA